MACTVRSQLGKFTVELGRIKLSPDVRLADDHIEWLYGTYNLEASPGSSGHVHEQRRNAA